MILTKPTYRGNDDYGSGAFAAPRGSRTHKGIDYAVQPGQEICPGVRGVVTKLGFAYADDLQWRYVEIKEDRGYKHRFFYVDPLVSLGDVVKPNTVIGRAQNIASRYDDDERVMVNHVHYEVKDPNGRFVNPETVA